MKMNDMFPSNFLKKEDVPQPVRDVIDSVTMQDVNTEGGKESKVVIEFRGNLKPMIVNKGNATTLTEAFGDDSDAWIGKTIEVYNDPSVMYGAKRIGGLRLRVPQQAAAQQSAASTQSGPLWDYSDGVANTLRQTTGQVLTFLDEMLDQNVPLTKIRVRPSGSKEAPVTADVWRRANDYVPPSDTEIPF